MKYFKLIHETQGTSICNHSKETLDEMIDSPNWIRSKIDMGILKFTCKLCGQTREYKQMTERVKL